MLLYKYLPLDWDNEDKELNQKRCDSIKTNSFWFSKPKTLNDPYDCKPLFNNLKTLEEVQLILDNLTDEELQYLLKKYPNSKSKKEILAFYESVFNSSATQDAVKNLLKFSLQAFGRNLVDVKLSNIGVLSLTKDPANCLMWSHYAKNHKGICLEIEIPKDTLSLREVTYRKKQPILSIHQAMAEEHGKLEELFYSKSIHWEYENEWRMIALKGNQIYTIPNVEIKRILFGVNTSDLTKTKILETTGGQIPTYEMTMNRDYMLG